MAESLKNLQPERASLAVPFVMPEGLAHTPAVTQQSAAHQRPSAPFPLLCASIAEEPEEVVDVEPAAEDIASHSLMPRVAMLMKHKNKSLMWNLPPRKSIELYSLMWNLPLRTSSSYSSMSPVAMLTKRKKRSLMWNLPLRTSSSCSSMSPVAML